MRETREELEDFFGAKVSDEEVEKSKWIHFHMRWENDYYDEHHKNDINSPREKFIQKVIMSKRIGEAVTWPGIIRPIKI